MRRFLQGTLRHTEGLGRPDLTLFAVTLILLGVGLIMVYSSSAVIADEKFGSSSFFMKKQLMRALIGIMAMAFFASIDYRVLRIFSKPAFAISIILLASLLIPGAGVEKIHGTRGWRHFGFFQLQPAEISRVALLMVLSTILCKSETRIESFKKGFLPCILLVGVVVGLIIRQPDLGSAAAIALAAGAVLFVAGSKPWHLGLVAVASVGGAALTIKPYQLARLTSFIQGGSDLLEKGWQLKQSLISLGSGGLIGRGLGQGIQKFHFLPELHTDFIFSIIGEEVGLVGTSIVLLLFLVWVVRGFAIASKAPDRFGFLLASSLTFGVMAYVVLNIAVATGLAPTTGLPLPFISYGGSALTMNLAATGMILSVSRVSSGRVRGKSFG
ncbi:MAG: putative lipid II flippase FtsW [Candidatus Eisenbacteria bacterium]|nr:putative lipid II flippase FtsW [Candidatus Eisenbacteria bacterium]